MGMSLPTLEDLITLRTSGRLHELKAVCDLGVTALEVCGNGMALRRFLDAFGCQSHLSDAEVQQWSEGARAEKLWRACGVEYLAIDQTTDFPALPLDLNFDAVPARHRRKYQLVMNFDATGHVCNQLNAMKIIHDLCAPGGWIYHVVPFSGFQNHGFFRYNAKFFWSLCRSNEYGYQDLYVDLSEGTEPLHPDIVENMRLFEHDPEPVARFSTVEGMLHVLLQKPGDAPFKPPFEGVIDNSPNGIPQRYHEIFRSDASR
jgi:hypothetical protein